MNIFGRGGAFTEKSVRSRPFRSGPLYITTVFELETPGRKLKAVHSRHELFAISLPGSTSSPEQYYGECEVVD